MRQRYTFDNESFVECGHGYSFYPHPSGSFFYLEGGNSSGCRVLVEFNKEALDSKTPSWIPGIGSGLHAQETVLCTPALGLSVRKALQQAANSGSGKTPLLDIWQVPGFEDSRPISLSRTRGNNGRRRGQRGPAEQTVPAPTPGTHRDGWFTRSRFSIAIAAPAWAPDAQAFDLREGVYLAFADGTFRLIPKREYFAPYYGENIVSIEGLHYESGRVPDARQGDLLLYEEAGFSEPIAETATDQSYDRHLVSGYQVADRPNVWSWPTITHPEHATLEVEGVYRLVFAPGTSRPFAREAGIGLD